MSTQALSVEAILEEHGLRASLPDIGAYVARQRWSGARDTELRSIDIEDATVLAQHEATLIFTITAATFTDGRVRRYALPLGLRRVGDALAERAPTFMIGTAAGKDAESFLYDALGDPAYIHWIWQTLREQGGVTTVHGRLHANVPDVSALQETDTPWTRVLTAEQSNTSLEVGDHAFLKHQRRIEPGPSNELEMSLALTSAGFEHIAPILATLLYESPSIATTPVVLVQPFLRNATDGWVLSQTSLRDLYAEAEEALAQGHLDPQDVVQAHGGSFAAEAARLGEVVAEMHLALARSRAPGMRTEPITLERLGNWATAMIADLDKLLSQGSTALAPLRGRAAALRMQFDTLRTQRSGGVCTRIHGDLHLGQTLRVDSGWVILDFEGEPNRTPAERRELSTPLRDVAGMLRSFDYAAAVSLTERVMPESADWEGLMAFGDAWAAQNRSAFWEAYRRRTDGEELLPAPETTDALLRAFELQKAVYEVGYELGHRPTWVPIPLRFLLRGSDVASD